jgi:two-component system, NtrC family, nitrogen regulation response regulator NtrX
VASRLALESKPPTAVLVVEDDESIRRTITGLLADEGFEVLTATTVVQALSFVRSPDRFRVVVLDLVLEDGDADAVLESLHGEQGRAPSVVMISAVPRAAELASAYGIPLVTKPFELDTLAAAIDVACDHNLRAQRAVR